MPVKRPVTTAYRRAIAGRCAAAALGGFALTSAAAIVLALVLIRTGAMPRVAATATATHVSFAVWAGVVVWAFTTRSVRRVWLNLLAPAAVLGALAAALAMT